MARSSRNLGSAAADWHELGLMTPQRSMRPTIRCPRQRTLMDSRYVASRHTTSPVSHFRPSPRSS